MGDYPPINKEHPVARYKSELREQSVKETRQNLLQAAAEEFAREGYRGANINRISTAAGFAKSTVYNHFPSKRALMVELIKETAKTHYDFIAERVEPSDDPVIRLELFFEAGFGFVSKHYFQGRAIITTLYGPDEEFKQVMYEAYLPMFQFVGEKILAQGVAQGKFRQVDPTVIASLLMTIYLGTASQTNEQGIPWMDPKLVADFTWNALRQDIPAPNKTN